MTHRADHPHAPTTRTAGDRNIPTGLTHQGALSTVETARRRAGDLGRRLLTTPVDEHLYEELATFLITDAVAALACQSLLDNAATRPRWTPTAMAQPTRIPALTSAPRNAGSVG